MGEGERPAEFLPPQAPGPEPELGEPPGRRPPEPPPQPPLAYRGPPQPWQAPPGWQQAPPQWQPPVQWQPPPAPQQGWAPAPAPPQAWWPQPQEPGNDPAVAGFVLSLVACGLLVASFGLSSLLSVGCAIFGIVQSRKGRRRVVAGETRKHQGLAHAGYVIGIVGLVLAVLATLFWALAIGAGGISGDLENDPNELEPIRVALLGGALLGLR